MFYSYYTERHILIATIILLSNSRSLWPAHLLLLQDNCVELSFLARISSTANPFFIIVVKVVIHFRQYFHCSCQVSKPSSVLDSRPKITWGMCFLDFFRKISEWARLAVFDISCDFGQKRWFSDDSHTLVNIYAYCVRKISSCLHNSSKDFSQMVRSY